MRIGSTCGDRFRSRGSRGKMRSLRHPQQFIGGCLVVIVDRDTGRSKGFGFVEMDGDEQAVAAIDALNG